MRSIIFLGIVALVALLFWIVEIIENRRLKDEIELSKKKTDSLDYQLKLQQKLFELTTQDSILTNETRRHSDSVNAAKQFFK